MGQRTCEVLVRNAGLKLLAACALCLGLGCGGDDVTNPTSGSVEITTVTSGPEPDADGYAVTIDAGAEVGIALNGTHRREDLEPGSHSVQLVGLAPNCTVTGDNPRTITVAAGAKVTVEFSVTCGPTTGSLTITASTSGPSPDADGYSITVDGSDKGTIAATAELTLNGLPPGDHQVGLSGIAANCQAQGDNPRTATIVAGATGTAAFIVTCAAPPPTAGSLTITTTTTGPTPDPDGYRVALDGGATQSIALNATVTLTNVAASAHTVRLSGVAANCQAQGANPRPVTVVAGATATVSFTITCTATTGSLKITTITTGSSPDPDGYTSSLDGGAAQSINVNAAITVENLAVGPHTIALAGVAPNCLVGGDNPRVVTVTAGAPATTTFSVRCHLIQGTKIAFIRRDDSGGGSDIFVMNTDGTGQRNLTAGSGRNSFPCSPFEICHPWSPDGTRLVFTRCCDAQFDEDIFVMHADGSGQTNLTRHPTRYGGMAWSPNGQKIAFHALDRGLISEGIGSVQIYVMNADGTGRRRLTNTARESLVPAWSPDGQRIAFRSSGIIYVMNADGSRRTALTSNSSTEGDDQPVWSPDGSKIAFVRDLFEEDRSIRNLYVMNADGSGVTALTHGTFETLISEQFDGFVGGYSWSPDGSRLAFANTTAGVGDIWTIRPDGTGLINLTNGHYPMATHPAWSPDGTRILFSGDFGGARGAILVMDTNGGHVINLTNDSEGGGEAVWQP